MVKVMSNFESWYFKVPSVHKGLKQTKKNVIKSLSFALPIKTQSIYKTENKFKIFIKIHASA